MQKFKNSLRSSSFIAMVVPLPSKNNDIQQFRQIRIFMCKYIGWYKNWLTYKKSSRHIASNENNPQKKKKYHKIRQLISDKKMDEKNI